MQNKVTNKWFIGLLILVSTNGFTMENSPTKNIVIDEKQDVFKTPKKRKTQVEKLIDGHGTLFIKDQNSPYLQKRTDILQKKSMIEKPMNPIKKQIIGKPKGKNQVEPVTQEMLDNFHTFQKVLMPIIDRDTLNNMDIRHPVFKAINIKDTDGDKLNDVIQLLQFTKQELFAPQSLNALLNEFVIMNKQQTTVKPVEIIGERKKIPQLNHQKMVNNQVGVQKNAINHQDAPIDQLMQSKIFFDLEASLNNLDLSQESYKSDFNIPEIVIDNESDIETHKNNLQQLLQASSLKNNEPHRSEIEPSEGASYYNESMDEDGSQYESSPYEISSNESSEYESSEYELSSDESSYNNKQNKKASRTKAISKNKKFQQKLGCRKPAQGKKVPMGKDKKSTVKHRNRNAYLQTIINNLSSNYQIPWNQFCKNVKNDILKSHGPDLVNNLKVTSKKNALEAMAIIYPVILRRLDENPHNILPRFFQSIARLHNNKLTNLKKNEDSCFVIEKVKKIARFIHNRNYHHKNTDMKSLTFTNILKDNLTDESLLERINTLNNN